MTAGRERPADRVDESATPPDDDTDDVTDSADAATTSDTAEQNHAEHERAAEPVPPDPAAAVDALEEQVLGRRYDQVRDSEDETRGGHDNSPPDGAGTGANPEPSD